MARLTLPDGWIQIHTATEMPGIAGHAFGPFLTLQELRDFEQDMNHPDACVKTVMACVLPPDGGLLRAGSPDLMVLGALAYNWISTTHSERIGHDHHCALSGLEPGNPEFCHCGWSTFYGKYIELSREHAEART